MESQKWIRVKLQSERVKHHKKVQDLDVPEAVRGSYDEKRKRFVIQFKYIGDEGTERKPFDRYVSLVVGKHSQRLYAIEIDVDALRANKVQIKVAVENEVEQAFDGLVKKPLTERRLDNYQLAREAFTSISPQLLTAIA
jgi:hypothetical protein